MSLDGLGYTRTATCTAQRKQLLSLCAVVALMVTLGLTGGLELHRVQGATSRVGTERVPAVQLLASVDADIRAYRELQLEHVLARNYEAQGPIEAKLRARRGAVDSQLSQYARFATRGEERQLLTSLREAWSLYAEQADAFLEPSRNQDVDTARGYLNGVAQESFVAISEILLALRSTNARVVAREVSNSRAITEFGLRLTLALLSIAAVVAIASQITIFVQNARAERFRSLVHRSRDLTLVCDLTEKIHYASSAAQELLGVPDHKLLGRRFSDLVGDQHRDEVTNMFAGAGSRYSAHQDPAAQPVPRSVECRMRHSDGSASWVEVTSTDLTGDPAVNGVMLRLHDITERRNLERQLQHAQKLESVGQLAAGIAHEINTPMQFITDNIRFLTGAFDDLAHLLPDPDTLAATRRTGGADAEEGRPGRPGSEEPPHQDRIGTVTDGQASVTPDVDLAFLLREIPQALAETLQGADRVTTIVRAMKAFGHPGGEGMALADINEAIRNTVIVARSEIKQVADVHLVLAEDLPPAPCILGDINQVLLNLIVNAAQAIGEVHAQTGRRGVITVRTRPEGEFLTIEVEDTGCGIPPEIADRVFDQFFTTKPVGQGTGQGLSLAHTLVRDRHGGTITFTSSPGVGTTFTVRIPQQNTESAVREGAVRGGKAP